MSRLSETLFQYLGVLLWVKFFSVEKPDFSVTTIFTISAKELKCFLQNFTHKNATNAVKNPYYTKGVDSDKPLSMLFKRDHTTKQTICVYIYIYFYNFEFCIGVQLINNVVIVSGRQQRDSGIHIHIFILPQTPLPSRLSSADIAV